MDSTAAPHLPLPREVLPEGWDLPPFTVAAKIRALGNAVPMPMGRVIAQAVSRAMRGAVSGCS